MPFIGKSKTVAAKLEHNAQVVDALRAAEAAVEQILASVAVHKEKLVALEASFTATASQVVRGIKVEADADKILAAIDAEHRAIRMQEAALGPAKIEVEEANTALRKHNLAGDIAKLKSLNAIRHEAAVGMQSAVEALAKHFEAFFEASTKVAGAWQGPIPPQTLVNHGFAELLAGELWRANPKPFLGHLASGIPALPGAAPPKASGWTEQLDWASHPENLPTLVSQVEVANDRLVQALEFGVAPPIIKEHVGATAEWNNATDEMWSHGTRPETPKVEEVSPEPKGSNRADALTKRLEELREQGVSI